jgi:hypothetical protein
MNRAESFQILIVDDDGSYLKLMETIRKEFSHLGDEDRMKIFSLAAGICGYCRETTKPCRCWDDS